MSNRKVSIQDVAEHPNAMGVCWHGDYLSMLCPFHDDREPSLLVYSTHFICLAASCLRRGTLKTLAGRLDLGRGFPAETAPSASPKWSAILGPDGAPTEEFVWEAAAAASEHSGVMEWYARRGLADLVEKCRLGWWRGWFVTPVFAEDGRCLRVVLRAGPTLEEQAPRYAVSPGPATLYIPDWGLLHTRPSYLFFPFGIYDALTLCKLRLPAATGAGPCTDLPLRILDGYRRRICVIPDDYPKEERVKARLLVAELGWRGRLVDLCYPEGIKDANDFLRAGREKELARQLARWSYD